MHISPKKSLGQNFLIDKNYARKIVASLNLSDEDNVIEIGAGAGALTELILRENIAELTAIEYDSRAVALLREKFPANIFPKFKLWEGSVLDFLRAEIEARTKSKNLKIIGNIPYNITSEILFWLFNFSPEISKALIMMQREVAQRLVAQPRTKEYGVLTIATAFAGKAKILYHVPPGCFFPKPSVVSSVVEFTFFRDGGASQETYKSIKPLVREAFNQRRKTLSNALKSYISRIQGFSHSEVIELAQKQGLKYFQCRAEELSPQDFLVLYNFLQSLAYGK